MSVSDPGAAQRVASLTTTPTLFPVPKPTLMAQTRNSGWMGAGTEGESGCGGGVNAGNSTRTRTSRLTGSQWR